ncbi:MAG: biotin--[acetyl-CoA-carboxylase] ligase, partial [Halobacteria archaeon]|nr:biotin--[acetyl-CoA-carboxylase] ligase [Halobacteria archaeon]
RREREWVSPERGAWFSLVLRPELSPREASVITLAASVAVARALRGIGVDPEIKWPNDVLIDGRKVCGILVELQADAEMVDHAVVGIGLNANSKPDVPDADPTSVRQELGDDVDRAELVADVLTEFEKLYGADHDEVLEEWNSLSSTLGREVRVETTDGTVEGVADRLDTTGALVVSTDDGERVIAAGDCEHLRGS